MPDGPVKGLALPGGRSRRSGMAAKAHEAIRPWQQAFKLLAFFSAELPFLRHGAGFYGVEASSAAMSLAAGIISSSGSCHTGLIHAGNARLATPSRAIFVSAGDLAAHSGQIPSTNPIVVMTGTVGPAGRYGPCQASYVASIVRRRAGVLTPPVEHADGAIDRESARRVDPRRLRR